VTDLANEVKLYENHTICNITLLVCISIPGFISYSESRLSIKKDLNKAIIYRYIMLVRGISEKYQARDEKVLRMAREI
jgi:hypothetical protein